MTEVWPRPVPTVGDSTSAAERAADPTAWAFPPPDRQALARILQARRDVRRFRADPVPADLIERILAAAHAAPSVGHSQPWRFVVVRSPVTRSRAAAMADQARLTQAAQMEPDAGRHLLDLDLEGIREAPIGVVVACDRRASPAGVLGRATFSDSDMWSCACAIENLWLAARAEGLGVGWVTLFEPADLAALVGLPAGVEPLGWLCVGWPDERPPAPGLERRGWSTRHPLAEVVFDEEWPDRPVAPPPDRSRTTVIGGSAVAARDRGDELLTPVGSLGVLDRILDRVLAAAPDLEPGFEATMVIAAADHPVAARGVSAFESTVTRTVCEATLAGRSVGAVAANSAGVSVLVVDAGLDGPPLDGALDLRPEKRGDITVEDGLSTADACRLVEAGAALRPGGRVVAVGEVGVGNTTVAAAAVCALTGSSPEDVVGLGAGSDSAIVAAKVRAVTAALERWRRSGNAAPLATLAAVGGGELAVLTGVILGASAAGQVVVLDGMLTGCAALFATAMEPSVAGWLVAGQRSREKGHPAALVRLGLEPLLDLRLRAGEGVGASMAMAVLRSALAVRLQSARTAPRSTQRHSG